MNQSEPEFAIGERITTCVNGKQFTGEVLDRHLWDGDWWYTIDHRNYLDQSRWERAA